jgi:small subunit ribosomal protein S6
MRRYESVWVVHGDLPDEEVQATVDKFGKIITNQGGILVGIDEWGRRKLAYKIKGTFRGFYLAADFAGQPAMVRELERNYRIDDRVIRYLTIKKSDHVDLAALEAEIAQRVKAPRAEPQAPVVEAAPAVAAPAAPETPAVEAPAAEPEAPAAAVAPDKEN